MKHLFNKISRVKPKVLVRVKAGSTTFNIILNDKTPELTCNGYGILKFASRDNLADWIESTIHNILPAIEDVKGLKIAIYRDQDDPYTNAILEKIKPALTETIVIKNLHEDTHGEQDTPEGFDVKDINNEHIIKNLALFGKKLSNLSKILMAAYEDAELLIRKKLVKTMWGADFLQKIFDNIKLYFLQDDSWDKLETSAELIQKSIERLRHKLSIASVESNNEECQVISNILIPNVIGNYESIKGMIEKAVLHLNSLVNIDRCFKEHTTYPATWFFDEAMFKGLQQEYEYLLKFLHDIPKIERYVMEPLDFLRVRLSQK